jgi:hypothetical protein
MDTFLHNLFARITTWLGDSANGIQKIFAVELNAKKLLRGHHYVRQTLRKGRRGVPVCVTGTQLKSLLTGSILSASTSQAGAAGTPTAGLPQGPAAMPAAAASATSGPPIIAINGDNPATIKIGATYAGLGARITAPAADTNLGLTTL